MKSLTSVVALQLSDILQSACNGTQALASSKLPLADMELSMTEAAGCPLAGAAT